MKRSWSKNVIVGLITVLLGGLVACGKKGEAPKEPVPVAVPQAPEAEPQAGADFKPPQVVKKQARYFSEGSPTRAIQDLDDTLDSYVINPKTPEEEKYNADLKRYVIHGTFDIRELSKLALGRHWDERTPQEQDYFVDLMTRLLEKKAIFSKEQGQKKRKSKTVYQVTYEGDKFLNPDKTQAMSMSAVHIPSENLKIELNYKLKKTDHGWVIYDVIVDGASLLDNYKYQFDKIIAKDGYPTLVHRMESKLKELEQKNEPAQG